MATILAMTGIAKTFILHLQGGTELPIVSGAELSVARGECVALAGPSGAGKSSLLKMIYGNYRCDAGQILLCRDGAIIDLAAADPRLMLDLRRDAIGYVSQFLRVIPRVPARDIVAAPLIAQGADPRDALSRAEAMLSRLNLPERLWSLPPATFSGGEQQRVNIARGFLADYPLLLLDEPTASLDARNRAVVMELVREKKEGGAGLIGIFHDGDVRAAIADRVVDVTAFAQAA